jgi:glycine/D-amino acid oxidase-like deaminating enzyme
MNRSLDMPDPGAARSFWLQEALAHDPGEPTAPLTANLIADVCIVGGGFAGLWTAVELSRRAPELRIALVEQDICGGGASGRNGGFFSSAWWDVQAMCGLFGQDEGIRYAQAIADTVNDVGMWLGEHDVDAWFHHDGIMGIQTGPRQEGPGASGPAEFLASRGLADRIRPIALGDARKIADSPRITSASMIDDGSVVQPARLARGLRAVALAQGVRIFERTKVTDLERSRPAVVRTQHGAMRATHVVITIGAWAAGWPGFRRSFGVVSDHMVVTEPIPGLRREIGWTSYTGIADGRELPFYLGGRGGRARAAVVLPAAGGCAVHACMGRTDRCVAVVPAVLQDPGARHDLCGTGFLGSRAIPDHGRRAHPGIARVG